jgi:hypothetical protein
LQRGNHFGNLVDEEALVDSSLSNMEPNPQINETQEFIRRMESLYFKLWVSLRWAVRAAFAEHNDILDAGGAIQVNFNLPFHATPYPSSELHDRDYEWKIVF